MNEANADKNPINVSRGSNEDAGDRLLIFSKVLFGAGVVYCAFRSGMSWEASEINDAVYAATLAVANSVGYVGLSHVRQENS